VAVTGIKDIVKNNVARFSFYPAGHAFCDLEVDGTKYKFPVSLEDLRYGDVVGGA
jgi:hypothetical protein